MSSLQGLGFGEVQDVRIGKSIEIELDGLSVDEADSRLRRMCESILVNPVIEDYQIEIVED
ncbi:MAG TPA: phosphoribosylformylglycinamidine synthase subunit PurS [SAR324 cluster bacterium]|jgi:phosphoribosylformylglycinamidine synthase|nr:phosphoribosylformylglycinamidine synthase subunit PurS [Deltaproteobacteria bacterium]HJM07431.1 phosphoribosylformylglycinamidine synthase subunit PurS [SAR324 cluster bacterium]HJO44571.1 phosphoribosylformylglycinamidine synthase subunit PurS [SAR324 cluster bacterium]